MTNTALLDELIEQSGLRPGFICEKLGISRSLFSLKRANKREFKASEIAKLCKLLNISRLTDVWAIFFAGDVE